MKSVAPCCNTAKKDTAATNYCNCRARIFNPFYQRYVNLCITVSGSRSLHLCAVLLLFLLTLTKQVLELAGKLAELVV